MRRTAADAAARKRRLAGKDMSPEAVASRAAREELRAGVAAMRAAELRALGVRNGGRGPRR